MTIFESNRNADPDPGCFIIMPAEMFTNFESKRRGKTSFSFNFVLITIIVTKY